MPDHLKSALNWNYEIIKKCILRRFMSERFKAFWIKNWKSLVSTSFSFEELNRRKKVPHEMHGAFLMGLRHLNTFASKNLVRFNFESSFFESFRFGIMNLNFVRKKREKKQCLGIFINSLRPFKTFALRSIWFWMHLLQKLYFWKLLILKAFIIYFRNLT